MLPEQGLDSSPHVEMLGNDIGSCPFTPTGPIRCPMTQHLEKEELSSRPHKLNSMASNPAAKEPRMH